MWRRLLTYFAVVVAALSAVLATPAGAARPPNRLSLSLQALLSPDGTDLYLSVTSTGGQPPEQLEVAQVKVSAADGTDRSTTNLHEVNLANGTANIPLSGLERADVVDVKAHIKDENMIKLEGQARVLLRPDLAVRVTSAPARVVRKQAFAVTAEIAELAKDTGANATVSLYDGGVLKATSSIVVGPGGTAPVSFQQQFATAGNHSFSVAVGAAAPAEFNSANNAGSVAVAKVAMYDADGAVTSDEPYATRVGEQILAAGGNAIDAAVAMQFVLGVTQPQNVGIGGGATVVLHLPGKGDFAIDARELSPAATDPDQFHLPNGNFKTNANSSGFIVGVPGSLKAAEVLLQRFGTSSLSDSLQPAIDLAANGFAVGAALASATDPGRRCQTMSQPETKALYCHGDGLEQGSTFVQPDLAKTYRLIAEQGTGVLYGGEIATAVAEATRRTRVPDGSGIGTMTVADIAAYTLEESAPISVVHAGHKLLSVGGSSAGGYIALQALRMLELRRADFPLGNAGAGFGWLSPHAAHVMTEAAALGFADHFYWMGGGAVPAELLSDCYLQQRANMIQLDRRIPRTPLLVPRPVGDPLACAAAPAVTDAEPADESRDGMTSHFSVLDKWGNAVSFTTTLTDAFGSGILVPGYGIVLNDALSNFNPAPVARPGAFPSPGDPGTNDPGPTKRARGYTAPLIALKDGEAVLITGSPGGAAIPGVVIDVVLNVLDFELPLQEAVDRPRLWWNMSTVLWNAAPSGPQIPLETLAYLRGLGNAMSGPGAPPQVGGAQSIAVDSSTFTLSAAKDRLIPDATVALVPPQ
jgi:gamma-glutamyltranspeptidase / glutathione hydrolase